MRILITTGLSKVDVGGPFQYGPRLEEEFKGLGHKVFIISYGPVEKALPRGVRHLYFFLRIFFRCLWAEKVLILDTFSVGIPTILAASFLGRKSIVRVGGDYLWSAYVNRTGEPITLPNFYRKMPELNRKEQLILSYTKTLIRKTDYLAFNTEWQRNIWQSFYGMKEGGSSVVRNFIPPKSEGNTPSVKNFLWAGRLIPEKNIDMLEKSGIEIVTGESHQKILDRIKNCYVAVSLAFTDISPNFIIEAISYHKPFIMTRETGLNELFPTGGIFVDPTNETEIEAAMEAMLDNNIYNKHVEDLKKISMIHSWNDLAKEFIEIWKKI